MPQGWTPVEEPKGWTPVEEKSAPRLGWLEDRIESGREAALGGVDDAGVPGRALSNRESWFETKLRPLLEKVAHPQTISDIANLLIPDAGVGSVMAAGKAAGGPAGRAMQSVGRGVEAVATSKPIQRMSELGAVGEALVHGNPGSAVLAFAAPRAAAMTGRAMQRGGAALERASGPAAEIAEAAPAAEAIAAKAFNPNDALKVSREAFKQAGVEPLKAEVSNAFELIRRGKAPEEAVSIVVKNRPGGVPKAPYEIAIDKAKAASPPKIMDNVKLTAEEMRLGMNLMERGKSPQEALDAVLAQRAFGKIPGVQSNATVASRVAERNASGRWP